MNSPDIWMQFVYFAKKKKWFCLTFSIVDIVEDVWLYEFKGDKNHCH